MTNQKLLLVRCQAHFEKLAILLKIFFGT